MSLRKVFVVEVTLIIDNIGTPQTFYYTDGPGFTTKPTDTPPNTVVPGYVLDPGSFRQELFSGARVTGPVRPSWGQIVLTNHDGVLDSLMGFGTGGKVTVRYGQEGAAYPGAYATALIAYVDRLIVDFVEVRIVLGDRLFLLDKPLVTDVFLGTGGIEGAGTASRKKPLVFGNPGYIPAVLIDRTRQIYYVQGNAADSRAFLGNAAPLYQAVEGGGSLTFGGHYPTEANLLNDAAPAPGTFKTYGPSQSPGSAGATGETVGPLLFRLGSPPAFDMRIMSIGYDKESATASAKSWTFMRLCARAGLTVELAHFAYQKQTGNYYVDAEQTYLQVMSDACTATFSAFGFDPLDKFFTIDFKDPTEGTDDPVYTFTRNNARDFQRAAVPGQERPAWQVNVNCGRTLPSSTRTSLTAAERDTFTREPWQTTFVGTSQQVKAANPGAETALVEITGFDLQTQADRLAYVQRYIYLFGGRRDLLTLTCDLDEKVLGIELHRKVIVKMARLGCGVGRFFRVITKDLNLRARTATFGLWGGVPGDPNSVILGGGNVPPSPPPAASGSISSLLGDFIQIAAGQVLGGGGGGNATLFEFVQFATGRFNPACTDGPVWTATTLTSRSRGSIAFGNGRFVTAEVSGANGIFQYSSDNGATWATSSTTAGTGGHVPIITFANGRFIAHVNAIEMAWSTDGDMWNVVAKASLSVSERGAWEANGEVFFTGNSAYQVTANGAGISRSGTLPTGKGVSHGAYGGGVYVAVGGTGGACYSTDGSTFTAATTPAFFAGVSVAYGAGRFVAVYAASASTVYWHSADGMTWTAATMPVSRAWRDVVFSQGVFLVSTNASADIAISTDGLSWTMAATPNKFTDTDGFDRIAHSGTGKYVAIRMGTNAVGNRGDCTPAGNGIVVLLLHCNGADGSTTVTDSSSYADHKTTNAGQTISTTSSKFGGSAIKVVHHNPAGILWSGTRFARTSAQLTIEGWFRRVLSVNYTSTPPIFRWTDSFGTQMISMSQYGLSNTLSLRYGFDTSVEHSFTPDADGYVHWAISVDASNNSRFFLNGVLTSTTTFTFTSTGICDFYVGGVSAAGTEAIEVYIDELRVTMGTCHYPAAFTPPTAAFPDA